MPRATQKCDFELASNQVDRLDSWKEIASYLRKSVRTVRRWEAKEALPVHRHLHQAGGTVYAFKSELDKWWAERKTEDFAPISKKSPVPITIGSEESAAERSKYRRWLILAAVLAVILGALVGIPGRTKAVIFAKVFGTKANPTRSHNINPRAYDAYSAGLYTIGGTTSPEALKDGIALFQKAISLQPDFDQAWAELAFAYYEYSWLGSEAPSQYMPKMEAAARNAIALNYDLPNPHFELATVELRYHWNWKAADREFQLARNLSDGKLDAPTYHEFLNLMGRREQSLAEAKAAQDEDPTSSTAVGGMAAALDNSGLYAEAGVQYRELLVGRPDLPHLHFLYGRNLLRLGHVREGIAELNEAVSRSKGNVRYLAYLGHAYAIAGEKHKARDVLATLRNRARQQYVSPYLFALIYVALGEKNSTFEWLEKACQARSFELIEVTGAPEFVSLRSDPRFKELAHRIGPPNIKQ